MADSTNKKSCLCNALPAAVLLGLVFFIGNTFVATDYNERISKWEMIKVDPLPITQSDDRCKDRCQPHGTDSLPKDIIRETSNLEMRPLWGFPKKKGNAKASNNLLTIAVGIKQKENVNEIVEKFSSNNFTIMLFHYDGVADEWNALPWSERALHVFVANQSKCYISIVQEEGLEISQPVLDAAKSQAHHQITVRSRRTRVHSFTSNADLCGILGLPTCGPHLSTGSKVGIALGAFIALALIFICSICWWKRRQNILRAQKLAARDAPYAKARTHFVRDVQMARPRIQDQARVAAEIGPRLLS